MRAYLSRTSAPTPVLIRAANGFQIILGKVRPNTSPGREPSTSSDHCSKSSTVPLPRPFHEEEDPLVGEDDQSLVLLKLSLPELGYGFTGAKDVPQMADLLASEEAANPP